MPIVLAVAAGGFLGGAGRYAVGRALPDEAWATFLVNVTGAFLLAVLLVLSLELWPPHRYLRPFAATGIIGSFTTFSTWMVEVDRMALDGAPGRAAVHLLGSTAAGVVAAYVGLVAGRLVVRRGRQGTRAAAR